MDYTGEYKPLDEEYVENDNEEEMANSETCKLTS